VKVDRVVDKGSEKARITYRKPLFSTPWFELQEKGVIDLSAPHYSLKVPDYVSVVPVTLKGEILLVRQYRPAVEMYTLELPSGTRESGEEPIETARRELWEETGYRAEELIPLPFYHTDVGRLSNRLYSFYCPKVTLDAQAQPEAGIEILTLTLQDLLAKIASGEFSHALHVMPVLLALHKGLF